jgi:PilZ domain
MMSGETMDEGRRAPRHRVLKAGTITFGGGAGISCTIRNLSDTGAALEVSSPIGIPAEFVLVVDADNSTRQCRVVWRKERRIGVTFQG